jgi:hypothetical protein
VSIVNTHLNENTTYYDIKMLYILKNNSKINTVIKEGETETKQFQNVIKQLTSDKKTVSRK